MKKIVFIGGPTASGKTDLAVEIAKQFNGELINADSRQIYKYLDIGTNKDDITEQNGKFFIKNIPIHLVNFLNPDERYSVYDFKQAAIAQIEDIINRGRLPIIVGGTGLYIDSIIKDYPLEVNKNNELRTQLEAKNTNELQQILISEYAQEFEKLNKSDKSNPRRLVRLIEKLKSEGTQNSNNLQDKKVCNYDYIFLYPEYNVDELNQKIDKRVEQMFNEGIVEETLKVLDLGFPKDCIALQGTGYKEVIDLINKNITGKECIRLVKISHRQYAKRQRTWFEGIGRGYKLTKVENAQQAIEKVKEFYE